MKKRVVIIRSNAVNPDSRVEKQAYTLVKQGYDVQILAWDRDKNYRSKKEILSLKHTACPITRCGIKASFGSGIKNIIPLLYWQLQILNYLIKYRKKIDIVHACDFDTAVVSLVFAMLYKKQIVYDVFDYYVDAFKVPKGIRWIIEAIDIQVINHADVTIITHELRKEQIKKARPKKLYIIHNTPHQVETGKNHEVYCKEKDKIKIGYVGVLTEDRLLKEMAEVIAEDSNYVFYIGGFGKLATCFEQMSETCDNIHFLGKLAYQQVLQLESECDVLVAIYDPEVPNHHYASPNKFYEALMLGKPILVAKGTGVDKIIIQEKIGLAIEYSKDDFENVLKHKVRDLVQDSQRIQQTSKLIYENKYSWDEMEKRIGELYSQLT